MTAEAINAKRALALDGFGTYLGIPKLQRILQRGRDPETARYTLELADGRSIRIGTIRTFWSQTELAKVLAVTLGIVPAPSEAREWRMVISRTITFGIDVEETPGETFEDAVREWAVAYGHQATTDREGAARRGDPFRDGDELHLTAGGLARYIRREYSEQIKLPDLRQALVDVGFDRVTIRYDRNPNGTGDDRRRSSTSYYRALACDLDPESSPA